MPPRSVPKRPECIQPLDFTGLPEYETSSDEEEEEKPDDYEYLNSFYEKVKEDQAKSQTMKQSEAGSFNFQYSSDVRSSQDN